MSQLEKQKGADNENTIRKRISNVSVSRKHKKREKAKKAKSNQHDAMVAHFNLRRLSIDDNSGTRDAASDMDAAVKAMTAKKEGTWKAWILRPMNPSSNFRRFWELMVLVLVLFQAIYIPLTVSFKINHPKYTSWWTFDLTADVIFMVDLVMTFNVGVINSQNKLVMDRKIIAIYYIKSWFLLDLAASVPFDLIIEAFQDPNAATGADGDSDANTASATSLLKGFKLPRLLRLLKIMRLMRLVKFAKIRPEIIWWFQYSRHSNLLRLISLFMSIIVAVHYMTCIFFPVMEEVWLSRLDCEDYTNAGEEGASTNISMSLLSPSTSPQFLTS